MADTTENEPVVEKTQEDSNVIPLEEIAKHNQINDLWMAINGKVYDVTPFVDQHPGGEEVLMEYAGLDATTAFDDVGHSENAHEMLADLYVGEGNPEELKVLASQSKSSSSSSEGGSSSKAVYIWGILIAVAAFVYFKATKA